MNNQTKSITQFFSIAKDNIVNKSKDNLLKLVEDVQQIPLNEPKRKLSSQNEINITSQQIEQKNQHKIQVIQQPIKQTPSRNINTRQYNESNLGSRKKSEESMQVSRIHQIQEEKHRINQQLKKLDDQIAELKSSRNNEAENQFQKRQKISKDKNAEKNAKHLVRQLNHQRKALQEKRKKQHQRMLQNMKQQEQIKRIARLQQIEIAKQQRRLLIEKRMQQQKKRKQQRKLIDLQSNQLIAQLKKQQRLQKQKNIVPNQLNEVEYKKKILQNKKKLDFAQIQEHQRKYTQLKARQKSQKIERMRQSSLPRDKYKFRHYGKNVWMEQIEQEQKQKRDLSKMKEDLRKNQLEKRLKYGELVKNIFLPKKKDNNNKSIVQFSNQKYDKKPHTPENLPQLPDDKTKYKRKTYENKIFKDQSLPAIKNQNKKRSQIFPKAFDPQKEQRQKLIKMRENQLRRQTNQRLKKLQNKSLQTMKKGPTEKIKYQNYLGKVSVKKIESQGLDWKKIINNQKLSEEQKYKELLSKANYMQNKAKFKEDIKKDTDQDTINLYIGSIQAKLALLQKF